MSLEARITMEPKAWLRFLDKLAAANMMHEFNVIEAAYTDAKRSKQLATNKQQRINGRFASQKASGMAQVKMVDL